MRNLAAAPLIALLPCLASGECSDAGICRLPAAADGSAVAEGSPRWHAALTLGYADGDGGEDLSYRTLTAAVACRLWSGALLRIELPWVDIDGRRDQADGLGDLLALASQRLATGAWGGLSAQAGLRLPTGDDNALPGLPQGYQPGLGSTDVLAGLRWDWVGLHASVAYQLVTGGANDLSGVHLERGDDIAAGIGYARRFGALTPAAALIAIRRLDESVVDDGSGGRVAVEGSDGTQVNLRIGLDWRPAPRWSLAAGFAKALRDRESDVDGLTRSWGADLGVTTSF